MVHKKVVAAIVIGLIILGAAFTSLQNPSISKMLTFPDSTGTSDSLMIPAGMVPAGIYTVDSLDNDTANVSFEISFGNQPGRIWYAVDRADTVIRDSFYYSLNPLMFSSIEGLTESETPVWIRSKTDSLQDGDRSLYLRFLDE